MKFYEKNEKNAHEKDENGEDHPQNGPNYPKNEKTRPVPNSFLFSSEISRENAENIQNIF